MQLTPVRFSNLYEIHHQSRQVAAAYKAFQDDHQSALGQQWFSKIKSVLAQKHLDWLSKPSDLELVDGAFAVTGRDIPRYKAFTQSTRFDDTVTPRDRFYRFVESLKQSDDQSQPPKIQDIAIKKLLHKS